MGQRNFILSAQKCLFNRQGETGWLDRRREGRGSVASRSVSHFPARVAKMNSRAFCRGLVVTSTTGPATVPGTKVRRLLWSLTFLVRSHFVILFLDTSFHLADFFNRWRCTIRPDAPSLIRVLSFPISPTAVRWLIVTAHIDAVQGLT